jgi:hypothetical protein
MRVQFALARDEMQCFLDQSRLHTKNRSLAAPLGGNCQRALLRLEPPPSIVTIEPVV